VTAETNPHPNPPPKVLHLRAVENLTPRPGPPFSSFPFSLPWVPSLLVDLIDPPLFPLLPPLHEKLRRFSLPVYNFLYEFPMFSPFLSLVLYRPLTCPLVPFYNFRDMLVPAEANPPVCIILPSPLGHRLSRKPLLIPLTERMRVPLYRPFSFILSGPSHPIPPDLKKL